MVTVTAPGADLLPWACGLLHVHSGKLGCRVDPVYAQSWNDSAPKRWAIMWQELRNDLRLTGTLVLAKVWEPQLRGVGHVHLLVPLEQHRAIVGWLKAHGPDYGFGFTDRGRLRPGAPAAAGAAYVASYIGNGGKVDAVCTAIKDRVIPKTSFYVAPSVSQGLTMRHLRMRRRAWAVCEFGIPSPMWATPIEWGRALASVGYSWPGSDPP